MKKQKLALAGFTAVVATVSAPVMAAVPAGAEALFTGIATDFGVIAGFGFVAMASVVGGLIVMKIVKKVANKAT